MTQKRPELIELLFGFFPAQVIQVAARLAIADHLVGGPRSTAQLLIGGRERTEEEFRAVFAAAGLTLQSVTCCPGPTNFSVLEAVGADAG